MQYWKMDAAKVGEVGGKEHAEFCFEVPLISILGSRALTGGRL